MSHRPPTDKYNVVYCIILLHGIGALMTWNMFITIAPVVNFFFLFLFFLALIRMPFRKLFQRVIMGSTEIVFGYLYSTLNFGYVVL